MLRGQNVSGITLTQTVFTFGNRPRDLNRSPVPTPDGASVPSARSFGGTFVVTRNPLEMMQQELANFLRDNVPRNSFPAQLSVIETPLGSVRPDPSVPRPAPNTGHLRTAEARIIATYTITYDDFGQAIFTLNQGN